MWDRRHEEDGHKRYWTPDEGTGVDAHRIGMMGEFAFYNEFGGPEPDLTYRPGGDGGVDSYMDLPTGRIPVDVKVSRYTGKDQMIAVPLRRMHPDTIYIAALYDSDTDQVNLVRWVWGHELVSDDWIRTFGRHENKNYVRLLKDCHPLSELHTLQLKARLAQDSNYHTAPQIPGHEH
jgi:hypothetical protein